MGAIEIFKRNLDHNRNMERNKYAKERHEGFIRQYGFNPSDIDLKMIFGVPHQIAYVKTSSSLKSFADFITGKYTFLDPSIVFYKYLVGDEITYISAIELFSIHNINLPLIPFKIEFADEFFSGIRRRLDYALSYNGKPLEDALVATKKPDIPVVYEPSEYSIYEQEYGVELEKLNQAFDDARKVPAKLKPEQVTEFRLTTLEPHPKVKINHI